MDWLTWFFLESPLALGLVAVLALFVLLVWWRRTGRVRPLLVGLAAVVVLLVVQAAVVTRREHALRLLEHVEQAILAGRAEDLGLTLAPEFRAGHMDREAFVENVRGWMQRIRVRWLQRQNPHVERHEGEQFVFEVGYLGEVAGDYTSTLPTRWGIRFVRTPQGWRILGIEPRYIAGLGEASWRALDRQ